MIVCVSKIDSKIPGSLLIDSAVFSLDGEDKTKVFYFIANQLLSNDSTSIPFTFSSASSTARRLQSSSSSNFKDKSYLGFISDDDEGYVDFRSNLANFTSEDGRYLSSGIYGAKLG